MIVLLALLALMLARGLNWISSEHFIGALMVLVGFVFVLMVIEKCRQELPARQRATKLQEHRETFCCLHCATRKPVSELSATIEKMCLECADLYETIQDEV